MELCEESPSILQLPSCSFHASSPRLSEEGIFPSEVSGKTALLSPQGSGSLSTACQQTVFIQADHPVTGILLCPTQLCNSHFIAPSFLVRPRFCSWVSHSHTAACLWNQTHLHFQNGTVFLYWCWCWAVSGKSWEMAMDLNERPRMTGASLRWANSEDIGQVDKRSLGPLWPCQPIVWACVGMWISNGFLGLWDSRVLDGWNRNFLLLSFMCWYFACMYTWCWREAEESIRVPGTSIQMVVSYLVGTGIWVPIFDQSSKCF